MECQQYLSVMIASAVVRPEERKVTILVADGGDVQGFDRIIILPYFTKGYVHTII